MSIFQDAIMKRHPDSYVVTIPTDGLDELSKILASKCISKEFTQKLRLLKKDSEENNVNHMVKCSQWLII